jgi:hypothetical protein
MPAAVERRRGSDDHEWRSGCQKGPSRAGTLACARELALIALGRFNDAAAHLNGLEASCGRVATLWVDK